MTAFDGVPIWILAIAIFCLRIVDVSVGTIRTLAVVQGRTLAACVLGFCEALVWLTVMKHVIHHASDNTFLLVTCATGFAAGNAVGITLERRLALGNVIVRVVSMHAGDLLTELFRSHAAHVFTFEGRNSRDPMQLIYVVVRRRDAQNLINLARRIDPDLYFAIDPLRESNAFPLAAVPAPPVSLPLPAERKPAAEPPSPCPAGERTLQAS